ncbi:hypothetical protein Leryth_010695 [Lithospermum erythrorhizon]|nr:hypothetical protein Leryth_010695 [Lithospermum erythrorhizon]
MEQSEQPHVQPEKQQLLLKRQLPFTAMKPPFADYHQFFTTTNNNHFQEPEGIVVKTLRKSNTVDCEAETTQKILSQGSAATVNNSLKTPVSRKGGKAQKVQRIAKSNLFGAQNGNKCSPSALLTPGGPCRYDSSLGLLTRKFVNLIKHAEDGILDLNQAADTLEMSLDQGRLMRVSPAYRQAEIDTLALEERRFDEHIRWLFVTEEDIKSLPCFQNETLIAIKAPHGTTLEVPDPDAAIDYPHQRSQFEEKFEEINAPEPPPCVPAMIMDTGNPAETLEGPDPVNAAASTSGMLQQEYNETPTDLNTSNDFGSGIMKIVPNVDSDADYWLLSDAGVSFTDLWADPGIDWNDLGTTNEGYPLPSVSTPQSVGTPPSNTAEMSCSVSPSG